MAPAHLLVDEGFQRICSNMVDMRALSGLSFASKNAPKASTSVCHLDDLIWASLAEGSVQEVGFSQPRDRRTRRTFEPT